MSTESLTDEDVFWAAVVNRDRAFDGQFFFGVTTTEVYCRPSCACRQPLRKNVRFYKNVNAAEQAGLRACKRCKPNEAERLLKLAKHLSEHTDVSLPLHELALMAGMSRFYFQRRFKAVLGVSPRQFVEGCRLNRLKHRLRADSSITDALYEVGFGSSSRLYEKVDTHLGMTPAQYRSGAKTVVISYVSTDSALGRMMIGATDRGICFIQFADSHEDLLAMLSNEFPAATLQPMISEAETQFQNWMSQLHEYLAGSDSRLELPLDVQATAFQMKVWRYLQTIPYGSVKSYSDVASEIGQPKAARAIARACATNKIALLIPCHRVIRGSGDLAGYKWGLDRKKMLLEGERRVNAGPSPLEHERSASRPLAQT